MIGLKFKKTGEIEKLEYEYVEYPAWAKIEVVGVRLHRIRKLPKSYEKYHHDCPVQIIDYHFDIVGWDESGKRHFIDGVPEIAFFEWLVFYDLI